MPSPLVANTGVAPGVAEAYEQGGREVIAGYVRQQASEQAVADAAQAKQDQIDSEDRATKRLYALEAYKFQQQAALTKAQNAVEFNESHWTNVTDTYRANLAEKQANAELWLDPKNAPNITSESQAQAREVVSQVQGIYQHLANNTPTDFSTYHEPADVINAKPFTAQFTPQYTKEYLADLDAKKQKDIDQSTHVQLENEKLKWEVAHPKQAHPGGGSDWYAHEDYRDHMKEMRTFYGALENAGASYRQSYGALRDTANRMPDDMGGTNKHVRDANAAAAELSDHLSTWGNKDPDYGKGLSVAASTIWNKGRSEYNGLSSYQDIDKFLTDYSKKVSKTPNNSPVRAAFGEIYKIVYGGGGQ